MGEIVSDSVKKPSIFVPFFMMAMGVLLIVLGFTIGVSLGAIEQLDGKNCYRVKVTSQYTYFEVVTDDKHELYACAKGAAEQVEEMKQEGAKK